MNRNDRMIKIDKYQVSNNNEQYHSLHNYQARPVPVRSVKDFFLKKTMQTLQIKIIAKTVFESV